MSAVVQNPTAAVSMPLAVGHPGHALVFDGERTIVLGEFLARARALAAALPEARHVVHLADDRYRFLLGFCAAALRGQVALLPPSGAPGTVAEILQAHAGGGAYRLEGDALGAHAGPSPLAAAEDGSPDAVPARVDPQALAAIGYTSGSTGRPQAHAKTWAAFATGTAQNLAALADLWGGAQPQVVATVPPQHMYGMELSVVLPLLGGAAVHTGRPLFPHDVAAALRSARGPRILVTTPVHLRALVQAEGIDWPVLAGVVCSTAPLPQALAIAAEARLRCEVRELFGSTETCVTARRRTALETAWTPLPGVRFQPQPDGARVHAAHLLAPVAIADLLDVLPDGRFELRGRNADLLEIAGKRASLGELNRILLEIPGVTDGVMFQLDDATAAGVRRIGALVVAPELSEGQILQALRTRMDAVFLPRRMKRVAALPRNATGKLPHAALRALLE